MGKGDSYRMMVQKSLEEQQFALQGKMYKHNTHIERGTELD
jgi:hypothetical protein